MRVVGSQGSAGLLLVCCCAAGRPCFACVCLVVWRMLGRAGAMRHAGADAVQAVQGGFRNMLAIAGILWGQAAQHACTPPPPTHAS